MTDMIKQTPQKQVRLGLVHNDFFINFCTMGFTGDNTLVFSSKFHTKKGTVEIGTSTSRYGQLINQKKEVEHEIKNGFHISLHPRGQIMHLRENSHGKVLSEKKFNWFPVKKSFHFISLYSPPLDECEGSKKLSPFLAPAPKNYKNSILMKVDIFPRNTTQHNPYSNSIWMFWGFCPEYFVRVSFLLTNHCVSPILFWPIDEGFLKEGVN